MNFESYMQPWLSKLGIEVAPRQVALLNSLGESMLSDPLYPSVSKISTPEDIALKHFIDSLAPLALGTKIFKSSKKIMDLGTGAGFPVLPLAVVLPEVDFVAVDSRLKSVEFVDRMALNIGLKNIRVVHSRIEELGQNKKYREQSDLVICRALSAVRILLEYTLPLTKVGGYSFYYKGPKLEKEVAEAENALKQLGIKKSDVKIFQLLEPELPFSRGYLQIKKTKPTAGKFPRKNGTPASKPL
ncbi:MAG: 16S rRNA (guanine(527)-N(7))-methyltransferase RsmG [Candidatus Rifleibacteriota bacterium]